MKHAASLLIRTLAVALLLSTAACRSYEIHQGNVMKDGAIWSIKEGDTKFKVESLLGTPALVDPLHPNRVQYVEELRNSEKEKDKLRTIEITYDDALRVKKIDYYGFDSGTDN